MSGLLELCESDDLSFDALQEKVNSLRPHELVLLQNQLCFHEACANENVTLKIVQLLYNILPGALRLRDGAEYLPIHHLCCNVDLDDTNSIDILRFMLDIDPNLSREVVGDDGYLPIHYAVDNKSTAFCKNLLMHIQNHCGL